MEEFKNLKEIIELCKEELDKNDENVNATLDFEDLKELQNLINKYKEQEKHIKALDSVIVEHIEKNKEQEKIIELMAEHYSDDTYLSKEDIINYFRKKAKGEQYGKCD